MSIQKGMKRDTIVLGHYHLSERQTQQQNRKIKIGEGEALTHQSLIIAMALVEDVSDMG